MYPKLNSISSVRFPRKLIEIVSQGADDLSRVNSRGKIEANSSQDVARLEWLYFQSVSYAPQELLMRFRKLTFKPNRAQSVKQCSIGSQCAGACIRRQEIGEAQIEFQQNKQQ